MAENVQPMAGGVPLFSQQIPDSCAIRSLFLTGGGFLMGAAMSPLFSVGTNFATLDQSNRTTWEKVSLGYRAMYRNGISMGKNFAVVGGLYSGIECIIEKYRAKHDHWNPIFAGCSAGAVLGAKGGIQSAALGCAGFAAFSFVMEYFLTQKDPRENYMEPHELPWKIPRPPSKLEIVEYEEEE